jgi:murein L,D-transpeptidase YafK
MRIAAYLLLLTFCASSAPGFASTNTVSAVLVLKSDRVLRLLNNGKTLKEYRVSLGKQPVGHKTREGDLRTPEGRYILDWRNENSRFYRSIHISYPNARDMRRAQQMGADPGGMIMIHGRPSYYSSATHRYDNKDWTDGCIAVTDSEMDEIWEMVKDGTPIIILP